MARVAEAPRKSVGPGFELARWSSFSCYLPLSSVSTEAIYYIAPAYTELCDYGMMI